MRVILWHGWSDQGVPPRGPLDYCERLARRDHDIRSRARVFTVPGMYHCGAATG